MACLGYCDGIPRDLGKRRTEEVYSFRVSQGYEYGWSVLKESVDETKKRLEKIGLEVFVGGRAYHQGGCEDRGSSSIFFRRKPRTRFLDLIFH